MKIGILTFQNTLNYGAKFQEFALQKYINDQGVYAEVVDYINDTIELNEKPLKLKNQKSIKGIMKYFLLHKKQISKLSKFNVFTSKYIKKSNKQYTLKNKEEIDNKYDKIIVGSDQIWNTLLTNDDYTYYLDFLKDNNKKLSYAASFGFSNIPNKNINAIKKLLKEFTELNVREETGNLIIKDILKEDSNVVVDPVFLLEKREWKNLINNNLVDNLPYILVYMVDKKQEIFDFIDKLSKEENLKIIYIDGLISKYKVKNIRNASPEEFLGLINNAKYVVTGSFHAICMSILFKKNFYYMLNKYKTNSRIIDLVKRLGLEDRLINDGKCYVKTDINYKIVENKLNPWIVESKKILDKMIS